MDFIDAMKLDMAENLAIQRFPQYDLSNVEARKRLTIQQKKEVVTFLINTGLQMGLRPKK